MVAASCRGFRATTIWMVEQLGLAMMPLALNWATSWGLTSGTTRGMAGSMRHAEELSTTTQPAAAARGAYSRLTEAPAENSARSTSPKLVGLSVSTVRLSPWKDIFLPSEKGEAKSLRLRAGKLRSSRQRTIMLPTAPVAPQTATRRDLAMDVHLANQKSRLARCRAAARLI